MDYRRKIGLYRISSTAITAILLPAAILKLANLEASFPPMLDQFGHCGLATLALSTAVASEIVISVCLWFHSLRLYAAFGSLILFLSFLGFHIFGSLKFHCGCYGAVQLPEYVTIIFVVIGIISSSAVVWLCRQVNTK